MSHQSQCLVFSLIFLSLLNPLQSGSGILFPQTQPTVAKQTQQSGNKKPDQQPQQPQGDPKQTDILKQYPHIPPPTPTTQTPDQEPSPKGKTPFGQKLPTGSEINIYYDHADKHGDVTNLEGYVDITFGSYRLQADKVTFNEKTHDIVAIGNWFFNAIFSVLANSERPKET